MSRLLITTVGTSLLTNRDARPWAGWNGRAGDPLPESADVQSWLATVDPAVASAEMNTLRALKIEATDQIVFVHSDTPEGRFCSQQLRTFYTASECCASVDEREIKALGYQHDNFAQRGLRSLVTVVISIIHDARKQVLVPVFCATGGFKAEIAFLNLLGALLDVEVYYIHEQFREIVRLPRLPLSWNAEYVVQHRDFFEWIDSELRPSDEVESWLKSRAELRPLVEDSADGLTYLNAAGNLLYQAALLRLSDQPRAHWPANASTLPSEKNGVSAIAHHRPKGWEAFVNRLCNIDCVTRVAYDESAYGGATVKVLDAKTGALVVRFGPADNTLPLRVDTTAKGEAQTELVADYVRRRLV